MAKRIVYGIEIDTKDADNSIQKLTDHLNDLNQAAVKDTQAIATLEQEIESLGKTGKQSTGDVADGFSKIPGPIGAMGKALQGARGLVASLSTGFKALTVSMGAAFLPVTIAVGALVLTFKGLQQFFTSTEERANKLAVVMAQLGSVVDNVKEAFNNVVEGKFGAAFKNLTTEIVADAKAAGELTKELQQVDIATRKLNESRSETNKLIEEQRAIAKDLNKTNAERSAALATAIKLEEEQSAKELANAQAKYDAEVALAELGDTDAATTQELSDLKVKLSEIEASGLAKIRAIKSEQNGLDMKIAAEEKSRREEGIKAREKAAADQKKLDEEEAARQIALTREIEDAKIAVMAEGIAKDEAERNLAFDRKIEKLTNDGILTTELEALIEEERILAIQAIRDRYAEEAAAKADEEAAKKKAILDKEVADNKAAEEQKKADRLATIQQGLTAASNFASALQGLTNTVFANELAAAEGNAEEQEKIRKKQFAANKALQIVQAVIGTAQAVIAGFTAGASLGPAGVVMGPVMAALAAITGGIQIAAISAAKYSPTGGGSGSAPRGVPSPPAIQTPDVPEGATPNVSFVGGGNNLNTVGGGAPQPQAPINVNANVSISETEITGTQNQVSEYENASLLSGG